MSYTIDQFGFEPIDQIPVDENDWANMLIAFSDSDAMVIKRDFEGKSASNAAGAIRKTAEKLGILDGLNVITKKSTVYVQKKSTPHM